VSFGPGNDHARDAGTQPDVPQSVAATSWCEPQAELLSNGDFEDGGLRPWIREIHHAGTATIVPDEQAHTGDWAARLDLARPNVQVRRPDGPDEGERPLRAHEVQLVQSDVSLRADRRYLASACLPACLPACGRHRPGRRTAGRAPRPAGAGRCPHGRDGHAGLVHIATRDRHFDVPEGVEQVPML